MNYPETLDFLYSQLPIFQRQGAQAYNKDLTRTLALCEVLNNPHRALRFIHVAGTNGKGSVCHTLASIFKEAGYHTGLYTSPHLLDFRERIQLNGQYISKDLVCAFIEQLKEPIARIQPSFFELTVAMAFEYFHKEKADIVILETGMGGRLDSTNVVDPELSVITNISFDHMTYLGTTLEAIAAEKAGIIKPNRPVVVGEMKDHIKQIFRTKANEKKSILHDSSQVNIEVTDDSWHIEFSKNKPTVETHPQLTASYQKNNLKLTAKAFQLLSQEWKLTTQHLVDGIDNVQKNFPLLGRWQEIEQQPRVILDVGHNRDGISNVLEQLSNETFDKLHIVFGMVNDKDTDILELLPSQGHYHLTQPNIPRALPLDQLHQYFSNFSLTISSNHINVKDSISYAIENSTKNDLILVMGSLFVVAEALEYFQ